MARLLYDLTGLLHWYAYFRRPAGVQRVIEQVATSSLLQEALQQTSSRVDTVEFVVRVLGSDRFYQVDPELLQALRYRRSVTMPRLRRRFAETMRLATPAGLLAEARYFHLPYIAIGAARLERFFFRAPEWPAGEPALQPVAPPAPGDTFFNPGDLWWQKCYATSLAGLKERTGVRIVQMIHDLYVLERPDWSPRGFSSVFIRQFQGVAPHVDRWLTSSGHVKGQVGQYLQSWSLPQGPITVLPMGWDSFGSARVVAPMGVQAVLDRHGIGRRPFVLFVGTVEPRKNVSALLDAMESLHRQLGKRVPALVVVGGYGWRAQADRARLLRHRREGHAFWLRNVSDEELRALYSAARFSIMPSHGEGWGLAVQESIALGVPCIASWGGATREAGRDLAVYFDPSRPRELEKAMVTWIVDDAALARARARIEQALRTEAFPSWNDAAKVLLNQASSAPATR
jgi:glycosyltransferase involved in cell wall biosynthesis